MPIEFTLPEVSEGVEAADIAEILIAEGDVIEADQIVMELETEKAVVELPCPHAGRVASIHVAQGDTVPIGALILTIEESTGAATPSVDTAPAAPAAVAEASAPEPQPVQTPDSKPAAVSVTAPADAGDDRAPAAAGPATRRLARELGVDLHDVSGSGPGGRITAEDVQAHVRAIMSGGVSAVAGGSVAPPPLPDFTQFGPVERKPLNRIARSSAKNLSMCWNVIPHVTQHDLADITDLEAARRAFLQTRSGQAGPKITMTAIVMKAVVGLLKSFPHFNASLDPNTDELVLKKYYNIGCAVDTPNGLLVPVVKDVDQKTVIEVAADLTDLATRARDKKLAISEMQGATLTVTNLGGLGGTGFTPIVNYPEVAILGMSRSRKELQLDGDDLVERLMLPLSLSYDHRVVNGADAARFVAKLAAGLSDCFQMFIEC